MCDRESLGAVFDRLAAMHLVTLRADDEQVLERIAENARDGEAITVATNDEAAALNERIRAGRVEAGEVDGTITAVGSDDPPIGGGDLIQTCCNDTAVGVVSRQQWVVQHVTHEDSIVYACEVGSGRRNPPTVVLPARVCG